MSANDGRAEGMAQGGWHVRDSRIVDSAHGQVLVNDGDTLLQPFHHLKSSELCASDPIRGLAARETQQGLMVKCLDWAGGCSGTRTGERAGLPEAVQRRVAALERLDDRQLALASLLREEDEALELQRSRQQVWYYPGS